MANSARPALDAVKTLKDEVQKSIIGQDYVVRIIRSRGSAEGNMPLPCAAMPRDSEEDVVVVNEHLVSYPGGFPYIVGDHDGPPVRVLSEDVVGPIVIIFTIRREVSVSAS